MASSTSLFCSNFFISKSTRNTLLPSQFCLPFPSYTQHYHFKRFFPLPKVASVPYQPINFDYLQQEFNGHGVTFEEVGGSCMAKMELKNGSIATILLQNGLITSYKAPMWHGGKVELLHTAVSEGEFGDAIIQGGVSLNFNFQSNDDDEVSWSPTNWVLHNIKGNAEESIKVELINKGPDGKIGLKYIVTLEEDGLGSELEISNSNSMPLQMKGSILTHFTVSNPEATYAIGLERSNYYIRPPFESEFILSPSVSSEEKGLEKTWKSSVKQFFPGWGTSNQNNEAEGSQSDSEDTIGEEMDTYKQLKERISLVYTDAPRSFTLIDRGRRNSVLVGRNGFDETYLFSPGSSGVESYSKYAYICVGQAAVLQPIVLSSQNVWKGGQYLHNPNL
ncbi:protein NDH-DEPENDENT CYCLIC ELECTRON FLOW 5-like [Vicia villosa]|uniref:protein NDH-DEPENDENT CYCLIC ELECTRON FLOW 5-like n=1 Tax=Vicia villosa TaxID=3911 RepID=UPI00273BF249|nr:protein NDH-DEPENDENT CYCLIC ELECTRON FLOW 5-like [Vicia villosa]